MADQLQLRLVTPARELADETVESIVAQGALGQLGILPLHTAFLSALEPGLLSYRAGGSETRFAVRGGYLEVRDDVVTVLADEALAVEAIERSTAEEQRRRAEEALEVTPYGDPGHEEARRELAWAEVLVELAGR